MVCILVGDRQRTKDGVQLIVHPLVVGFGRTHNLSRVSVKYLFKCRSTPFELFLRDASDIARGVLCRVVSYSGSTPPSTSQPAYTAANLHGCVQIQRIPHPCNFKLELTSSLVEA